MESLEFRFGVVQLELKCLFICHASRDVTSAMWMRYLGVPECSVENNQKKKANLNQLDTAINSQSTRAWWEQRRLRYNIALVVAGVLAFAAYVVVVDRDCYNLGRWSESVIRPANVDGYRRVAYWMGFWFSVLLPFAIPAVVAWSFIIHPGSTAMPEP